MSIECFSGHRTNLFATVVVEVPLNIASARHAAEFVHLCEFDKYDRVTVAQVPGHECKVYEVRFNRNDMEGGQIIVVSCMQVNTGESCKGNRHGICYHSIAALIRAAAMKRHSLSFCERREDGESLLRMSGRIIPIRSQPSGKRGWVVYRQNE